MAETLQPHTAPAEGTDAPERPLYEPPRIQPMSEREILTKFQITQSMAAWWTTGMC